MRPSARATASEIAGTLADLEGRMRQLEKRLGRFNGRKSGDGLAAAAEQVAETVASALSGVADRFRDGTRSVTGEATRWRKEAAKIGGNALRRVSDEVERHPLLTVALAAGVGLLVLGLAGRRH